MDNSQPTSNCLYNLIYTDFNEEFSRNSTFYYNIQYPSFFNFNTGYFFANPSILNNINNLIKKDVNDFRDGLAKEEQDYNSTVADNNAKEERIYSAFSNFAVSFNKNHLLSVIVNVLGFLGNTLPKYNALYNYNYDLLTGNKIALKDIFNPGVDYIKVITDYVHYKINQNKNLFFENVEVFITDNQAFYLEDGGVVVYFDAGELAKEEFGTIKFKLSFNKFAPYINPRFSCEGTNLKRRIFRR